MGRWRQADWAYSKGYAVFTQSKVNYRHNYIRNAVEGFGIAVPQCDTQ